MGAISTSLDIACRTSVLLISIHDAMFMFPIWASGCISDQFYSGVVGGCSRVRVDVIVSLGGKAYSLVRCIRGPLQCLIGMVERFPLFMFGGG